MEEVRQAYEQALEQRSRHFLQSPDYRSEWLSSDIDTSLDNVH
jgi:hypothetical protein